MVKFKHMHFAFEQILNEAGLSRHSEHRFFEHTPRVLRHQLKYTESGKKCSFLRRELKRAEKYLKANQSNNPPFYGEAN